MTHIPATYIGKQEWPVEANAHLIAAAPAMYEALQQIEVAWRHFRGCNLMAELPGLYVTIKQALAQAEGK